MQHLHIVIVIEFTHPKVMPNFIAIKVYLEDDSTPRVKLLLLQ